jgi:hypothetical protein
MGLRQAILHGADIQGNVGRLDRSRRLTYEATPGLTERILGQEDGFRWGASLLVGGVQVPETEVSAAIRLCPFDSDDAASSLSVVRFAWAAGTDLDEVAAWIAPATRTCMAGSHRPPAA